MEKHGIDQMAHRILGVRAMKYRCDGDVAELGFFDGNVLQYGRRYVANRAADVYMGKVVRLLDDKAVTSFRAWQSGENTRAERTGTTRMEKLQLENQKLEKEN